MHGFLVVLVVASASLLLPVGALEVLADGDALDREAVTEAVKGRKKRKKWSEFIYFFKTVSPIDLSIA